MRPNAGDMTQVAGDLPAKDNPELLPANPQPRTTTSIVEGLTMPAADLTIASPEGVVGTAAAGDNGDDSESAFEAFRKEVEASEAPKRNTVEVNNWVRKAERRNKQLAFRKQLHRIQGYLGLRPSANDSNLIMPFLHPNTTFIAVDIEAFEFNQRIITEIGVSKLHTASIVGVEPGPKAANWIRHIKTRHIRVQEHKHHVNKRHVKDNSEKFAFGTTEWKSIKEVVPTLEAVFTPAAPSVPDSTDSDFPSLSSLDPFKGKRGKNNTRQNAATPPPPPKIVFVAHNKQAELRYFGTLGFDIGPYVHDILDSGDIFQASRRDMKQPSLQNILLSYGIAARHLHNAGNDAYYTLRAILTMAVEEIKNDQRDQRWEAEKERRMDIAILEAKKKADAEMQGWDTESEESDGNAAMEVQRAVFAVSDIKPERSAPGAPPGAATAAAPATPATPSTASSPRGGGTAGRNSEREGGRGRGRGRGRAGPRGGGTPFTVAFENSTPAVPARNGQAVHFRTSFSNPQANAASINPHAPPFPAFQGHYYYQGGNGWGSGSYGGYHGQNHQWR